MPHLSWLEIFGYVASVIVAISLMMGSILKLRWYNLVGAVAFATYGLMIKAYPVAVLNFFIALADIYYLIQLYRDKGAFQVLPMEEGSSYAAHVLASCQEEIRRYFPAFDGQLSGNRRGFYILRDLVPAGLFIAAPREDGELEVLVDFVLPAYRDFKPGRFVYQESRELFRGMGVRRLVSRTEDPRHADYLRRMGFVPVGNPGGVQTFALDLG